MESKIIDTISEKACPKIPYRSSFHLKCYPSIEKAKIYPYTFKNIVTSNPPKLDRVIIEGVSLDNETHQYSIDGTDITDDVSVSRVISKPPNIYSRSAKAKHLAFSAEFGTKVHKEIEMFLRGDGGDPSHMLSTSRHILLALLETGILGDKSDTRLVELPMMAIFKCHSNLDYHVGGCADIVLINEQGFKVIDIKTGTLNKNNRIQIHAYSEFLKMALQLPCKGMYFATVAGIVEIEKEQNLFFNFVQSVYLASVTYLGTG